MATHKRQVKKFNFINQQRDNALSLKRCAFVLLAQPEHTSLDIYGILKKVFYIYKLWLPFVSRSSSLLQSSPGLVHFAYFSEQRDGGFTAVA